MKEAMKQTNEMLKSDATEEGLSFNVNKTKIMVQSRDDKHIGKEIKKRGDMTEVVDELVYLGTCITKYRDELKDMRRRTGLAKNTPYCQ
jgi:hypothetical protein